MLARDTFSHLQKNVAKYPVSIKNYVVPPLLELRCDAENVEKGSVLEPEENAEGPRKKVEKFAVFQSTPQIVSPRICLWEYMKKDELATFLKIESKREVRKTIETKINQEYPKGSGRIIVIELMYNVRKFCISSKFNLEQAGATLSMFYLTHCYFTSSFYVSAEKVYEHFKDFLIKHSLLVPPKYTKVYSFEQSKNVFQFFCKLYLRHLPLIRLLTLPNYGFYLDCYVEPDMVLKKEGKNKDKGKKKDKKGKGKKK